jgi:hypothetical protein
MKYQFDFALIIVLTAVTLAFSEDQPTKTIQLKAKHEDSPFTYPVLELRGRVADIFTFYQAEWISGLTCRIKYNGKKPLPSKVFFSEYDETGKQISERIRLIYPKLNSDESGYATFRVKGHASKIVIWSEGDGPWENPY